MSNSDRVIMYANGKYRKITRCEYCTSYQLHHRDIPGRYYCPEMAYSTRKPEECFIEDKTAIHPDCPLPLLSDIIEHPADELPENGGRVELTFISGLKSVGAYDHQECAWYYNAGLGRHFAFIKLNSCGVANIVSWRELPQ